MIAKERVLGSMFEIYRQTLYLKLFPFDFNELALLLNDSEHVLPLLVHAKEWLAQENSLQLKVAVFILTGQGRTVLLSGCILGFVLGLNLFLVLFKLRRNSWWFNRHDCFLRLFFFLLGRLLRWLAYILRSLANFFSLNGWLDCINIFLFLIAMIAAFVKLIIGLLERLILLPGFGFGLSIFDCWTLVDFVLDEFR